MRLFLLVLFRIVASQTNSNVCLSREGTIQSLLEGLYEPVALEELGTTEYKRMGKDTPDLYIWYHNQHWFLSPVNYTVASAADASNVLHTVPVYGHCRGGTLNDQPSCEECWELYWEPTGVLVDDQKYEDCTFYMTADESYCVTIMNGYDGTIDYPDTLCLDATEDTSGDDDDVEYEHHSVEELGIGLLELLGEYEKRALYPYYMHVNSAGYMWHDVVTNHWAIGIQLNDPLLLCYDKNEIFTGCVIWNDVEKESQPIDNLITVSEECLHSHAALSSTEMVEIIVAIAVTVIVIMVIVVICVRKEKKEEHTKIQQLEAAEMAQTGLTDTTAQKKGTKGGVKQTYDMSPLNADDADDHVDEEEEEEDHVDDDDKVGGNDDDDDDVQDKDVSDDDNEDKGNDDVDADEDNNPDLDDTDADADATDLLTQES